MRAAGFDDIDVQDMPCDKGLTAWRDSIGALPNCCAPRGLTTAPEGWYEGRAVMVTRNDNVQGLMNRDVGIDGANTLEVRRSFQGSKTPRPGPHS